MLFNYVIVYIIEQLFIVGMCCTSCFVLVRCSIYCYVSVNNALHISNTGIIHYAPSDVMVIYIIIQIDK